MERKTSAAATGSERPQPIVRAMSRWQFDTGKRGLGLVYAWRLPQYLPLNCPSDTMLFEAARHERLLDIGWDATQARAAIAAIVGDMEATLHGGAELRRIARMMG